MRADISALRSLPPATSELLPDRGSAADATLSVAAVVTEDSGLFSCTHDSISLRAPESLIKCCPKLLWNLTTALQNIWYPLFGIYRRYPQRMNQKQFV